MIRRALLSAPVLLVACGDATAPLATTDDATSTSSTSTDATSTTAGADPTTGSVDETTTAPAEPTCCGCLCVDPGWSCALDTCLYEDGTVATLAPEAGFLTIAPYSVSHFSGGQEIVQTTPEARLWYAFRPADEHPETRPLVVLFNGGPGYSSAALFGFNTNAVTLDPGVAGDSRVVDNPHRWTRFANLLYVDPRQAGYSYDLRPTGGDPPELRFTAEQDASDFIQLVLAFLARHPQIEKNPVVLVGESYGGNRATLMLNQILHPERLVGGGRYRDPTLHERLLAHFSRVFPDEPAAKLTPQRIATQFGHQVLIQPALTWLIIPGVAFTPEDAQPTALGCIPEHDMAQCDQPVDWSFARSREVVRTLTDPNHLAAAFGVDVKTIAWMHADARATAILRGHTDDAHDESGLRAVFGELPPGEPYYLPHNILSHSPGFSYTDPYYAIPYLESLFFVRTFITDAGKDMVIYSPDTPAYLAARTDVVSSAVHDKTPTPGEDRPGWIRLDYMPGLVAGELRRDIRFPHYPIAGHIVTLKQGAELAVDVCRWLALDCPI